MKNVLTYVELFFYEYILSKFLKSFKLESRTCYYCLGTFFKPKRSKSGICSRRCSRLGSAFEEIVRDFQNGKAKGYVSALRKIFEEERDEAHFFKGEIRYSREEDKR